MKNRSTVNCHRCSKCLQKLWLRYWMVTWPDKKIEDAKRDCRLSSWRGIDGNDLNLNVDLMFVNTNAFVTSVSKILSLTIVNELRHRKGSSSLDPILFNSINWCICFMSVSSAYYSYRQRTSDNGSVTQSLNQNCGQFRYQDLIPRTLKERFQKLNS